MQPESGRYRVQVEATDREREVVAFDPGTVACLERDPIITEKGGHWMLMWHMSPTLLGA